MLPFSTVISLSLSHVVPLIHTCTVQVASVQIIDLNIFMSANSQRRTLHFLWNADKWNFKILMEGILSSFCASECGAWAQKLFRIKKKNTQRQRERERNVYGTKSCRNKKTTFDAFWRWILSSWKFRCLIHAGTQNNRFVEFSSSWSWILWAQTVFKRHDEIEMAINGKWKRSRTRITTNLLKYYSNTSSANYK